MAPETFYEITKSGIWNFFLDASLVKDFLQCEKYFDYRHVQNLRQKASFATKPFSMAVGGWWSDAMEMFYEYMKAGKVMTRADVQHISVATWAKSEMDKCVAAQPDKYEKFGDLTGATLMLMEYYEHQYTTDLKIWKVITTEAGFGLNKEVLVGATDRIRLYWVGKPDLTVIENGRLIPVDHKTVTKIDSRTIGKYKPGCQMPGYVFAHDELCKQLGYNLRVDRCVVNICARERPSDKPRDGKKKPRFIRAYPNFSSEEINQWKNQMMYVATRMRECIEKNNWIWREGSCHNMFFRDCPFVKADGSTPMARDIVLAADFVKGEPWRPYKPNKIEEEEE